VFLFLPVRREDLNQRIIVCLGQWALSVSAVSNVAGRAGGSKWTIFLAPNSSEGGTQGRRRERNRCEDCTKEEEEEAMMIRW